MGAFCHVKGRMCVIRSLPQMLEQVSTPLHGRRLISDKSTHQ